MTKRLNACLRLTLPKTLEARVLDHLLQHPEWIGPFTTCRIEGHGDPQSIASPAEQVRGHAERLQIEILMDESHVEELIAHLCADLPSHEVLWWLSPVIATGSLA